jgi:hypothetical protein
MQRSSVRGAGVCYCCECRVAQRQQPLLSYSASAFTTNTPAAAQQTTQQPFHRHPATSSITIDYPSSPYQRHPAAASQHRPHSRTYHHRTSDNPIPCTCSRRSGLSYTGARACILHSHLLAAVECTAGASALSELFGLARPIRAASGVRVWGVCYCCKCRKAGSAAATLLRHSTAPTHQQHPDRQPSSPYHRHPATSSSPINHPAAPTNDIRQPTATQP